MTGNKWKRNLEVELTEICPSNLVNFLKAFFSPDDVKISIELLELVTIWSPENTKAMTPKWRSFQPQDQNKIIVHLAPPKVKLRTKSLANPLMEDKLKARAKKSCESIILGFLHWSSLLMILLDHPALGIHCNLPRKILRKKSIWKIRCIKTYNCWEVQAKWNQCGTKSLVVQTKMRSI